jgi:MscS family membrane protein
MLVMVLLAYYISWLLIAAFNFLLRRVWTKSRTEPTAGIITALVLPFRLYLAVWVFVLSTQAIGISIIVRQRLSGITIIIGFVALLILLYRLADVISTFSVKRMTKRGRSSALSIILFLKRAAKVAIVVFGIIGILSILGFDVTTGLAALGIGGIALALGAQKTMENFVGSVTLLADQPIRVGDFCKVGETTGTVESIGMRSTRIRTQDRTIVTIPNGEFSSTRIENFAPRDQFLFRPILDLRSETTPDQIRFLLVELRAILYAHPNVNPDPAKIRFIGFGDWSIKLEVYAYIIAATYDEFQEIQEDILLRMMDIIKAAGTDFAFPSQTLYLGRDAGLPEEQSKMTHDLVSKWREDSDIQLPNYDAARIEKLKGTISYPSEGTAAYKATHKKEPKKPKKQ